MSEVSIHPCAQDDELYRQFDGQFGPQPVYIELDLRDGVMLADYDSEIGTGIPREVYTGIVRRYRIPPLTADAATRTMHEIAPLAQQVLADSREEWDGNNNVGRLGEHAAAAERQIVEHLGCDDEEDRQGFGDSDLVHCYDIDSSTTGHEAEEHDITADTTDRRLREIAEKIRADLAGISESGVAVCPGLLEHLKGVRDQLCEEMPLTGAELRTAREWLGLTGDHLARLLGVSPRNIRAWEHGEKSVPPTRRSGLAELHEDTSMFVGDLVRAHQGEEEPTLLTYRSDEEFEAADLHYTYRRFSAGWHRMATARAAAQIPGARIDFVDED